MFIVSYNKFSLMFEICHTQGKAPFMQNLALRPKLVGDGTTF